MSESADKSWWLVELGYGGPFSRDNRLNIRTYSTDEESAAENAHQVIESGTYDLPLCSEAPTRDQRRLLHLGEIAADTQKWLNEHSVSDTEILYVSAHGQVFEPQKIDPDILPIDEEAQDLEIGVVVELHPPQRSRQGGFADVV